MNEFEKREKAYKIAFSLFFGPMICHLDWLWSFSFCTKYTREKHPRVNTPAKTPPYKHPRVNTLVQEISFTKLCIANIDSIGTKRMQRMLDKATKIVSAATKLTALQYPLGDKV